jgi:hypothetical protein
MIGTLLLQQSVLFLKPREFGLFEFIHLLKPFHDHVRDLVRYRVSACLLPSLDQSPISLTGRPESSAR